MKKELFKQLSESLTEAVEIHKGKAKPSREFCFSPIDIKHVRESMDFSQSKFASMIGVSAGTLKNWEQGRRRPVGPAMVLLKVISENPKMVFKALRT
jgi:putative transcriptional regulator